MTSPAPSCSDERADQLLTGLIEQYSPSRQEQPAVEYLVSQMTQLGFDAHIDGAGNAVGVIGHGERTILLLGHIDTVKGKIEIRRDGYMLYGRGSVDAKGPLASFVAAAARAGELENKRIVVVGAVEEESATSKGARFLLDKLNPECVIIGEPSHWNRITVGYKGRLLMSYRLERPISHTAGPEHGACETAVDLWQFVAEHAVQFNAEKPRMFEQLLSSLRAINSSGDGFMETVKMTIGFRLPPNIDIDALQQRLRDAAGDADVQFFGREDAFRSSRSTPLARALARSIRAAGERAKFQVKSGTSDMNVVGPVWACPIVAYGPGDSALDHTPNEHIDLKEYHRALEVLRRTLEKL